MLTAFTARTRALLYLALGLALVTLAACPQVIREPTPAPPREGCAQSETTCHEGSPWVCGDDGKWSLADRRCDQLGARCCLSESPFGRRVFACVPTANCLDESLDGGAR